MAHLYGEALTMRAMAYVDLINAWGDVPLALNQQPQKQCMLQELTKTLSTNN